MERLDQGSLYPSIQDLPAGIWTSASQAGTLAKRYLNILHILTILIRYNA